MAIPGKKTILAFWLSVVILPGIALSQGQNNFWYFGLRAAIDFNTTPPTTLTNSTISPSDSYACISDSSGSLLMVSNAALIYNRNFEIMPNGFGLNGNINGTQSVLIIKKPEEDSLYYLFSSINESLIPPLNIGLYYSVVDLTLNNGFGDIVIGMKNIPVPDDGAVTKRLHATRHSNNRDIWLVTFDTNNRYLSYLIDTNGINAPPVVCQSLFEEFYPFNKNGDLKISQDGSKLIKMTGKDTLAEFCSFNNETGIVTPLFVFRPIASTSPTIATQYAEFSPNGKYVYITSQFLPNLTIHICQYNALLTDSASFVQSQSIVGIDEFGRGMQIGPDGKIYQCRNIYDYLNVIHNPNEAGSACNFEYDGIWLQGKKSGEELPAFLQIYKAYIHLQGSCHLDSIHFSGDIWPPADTIRWNFGDPASGALNISYNTAPSHIYSTPGIYTVELYVRHIDNRTDTAWIDLEIFEAPMPQLGNDTTVCQGDSVTFNAGSWTDCTYSWDNLSTGQTGIGNDSTLKVGASGIYAVTVTSSHGCTGYDTIELIVVSEVSISATPSSLSICSGDTLAILLQGSLPGCSFSWIASASSDSLSGYTNGSGSSINQTLYNKDTLEQAVTYSITPSLSGCTGISLVYPVGVSPRPSMDCNPSTQDICSGQQAVIHLTSDLSGTTFAWNAEASSPDITGYSPGSGSTIDQILINAGSTTDSVIYHITSVASSGCSGDSTDAIVSVIPTVITTITPPVLEICSGDTTEILLQGNVSGCSFSWVAIASSPGVSGYAPGNGDTIKQILTNTTSLQQTVTYSITPDVSGCGSVITDYIVTINPQLPVSISINPSFNPVCEGLSVTYSSTIQNGGTNPQYQWLVNGNPAGSNQSIYSYTPTNGDQITCTLTSSETCTSNNPVTSTPISMMVVDKPAVSLIACFDTITTTDAKPILLRGGVPLGGTYAGSSVSSGSSVNYFFDPSTVGPGTYEITYQYINSAGCEDSAKLSIVNYQLSIFNCGDSLIDIRDNQKYPTIQIGIQCWMATNLNYGIEIPLTSSQRDNCTPEKYNPSLYQWNELMGYLDEEEIQGLCPPGWLIPSEADWDQLFAYYQGGAFAGSPLLETGYSGFNAILSGIGLFNKQWYFSGFATLFWSSTSHGPYKAWSHGLNEYNYSVSYYPSYRANAFSVRCMRE